jgi:manganese oxidase
MRRFRLFERPWRALAIGMALVVVGFGLGMAGAALGGGPPAGAASSDSPPGASAFGSSAAGSLASSRPSSCRRMTLYAERLPDSADGQIRLGYGVTPGSASIPGPTIVLTVGQCLRIDLHNDVSRATLRELRSQYGGDPDLPLGVSIHPHGVKYRRDSDGTVSSASWVPVGGHRVFTWLASPISPGYWWYHDHVVGTMHGTGGIASGLFGGLVVRRPGDPLPDVPTIVLAFGDNATINLQHYPNTPEPTVTQGQRVEFLVFAWGNETHSFHLHGHTWADDRTGIPDPNDPDTRFVDNVTIGPGSSFGFQVIAGEFSGPNRWMYHCHVQFHSDQGMEGFFRVLPSTTSS